jgi:hypothetical protein
MSIPRLLKNVPAAYAYFFSACLSMSCNIISDAISMHYYSVISAMVNEIFPDREIYPRACGTGVSLAIDISRFVLIILNAEAGADNYS